jgi:hypothetical protein
MLTDTSLPVCEMIWRALFKASGLYRLRNGMRSAPEPGAGPRSPPLTSPLSLRQRKPTQLNRSHEVLLLNESVARP